MGRGFTSIPQREPTPEIPPPEPQQIDKVLGIANLIGPLPTQELTGPGETLVLGEPATEAIVHNTLGITIVENKIIFPKEGMYIVTISFYPVYGSANPDFKQIQVVTGSTGEQAFFAFETMGSKGSEEVTGEQLTCIVPEFGEELRMEFDFTVNGASAESPVLLVLEELMIIGIAP